jgi:phosphohistidine phosphatase SixA
MRVVLVRHCEAANGSPDELRPLTQQGRDHASRLGTELAAAGPDAVVSSPLLRARETAAAIAAACGLEAHVDERLAPGAGLDDLRAAASGRGDLVVAVGHQPDCGEIVQAATGRAVDFPPGSRAELEL